jgi:hypothetical protein
LEVALEHSADVRECGAELQHPVVFLLVALLAPQVVVAVLAAARRVGPGRLDVAERVGADPYVLPGWRDHQGPDASDRFRVVYRPALLPHIPEATSAPSAPDSRRAGIAAHQLAHGRPLPWPGGGKRRAGAGQIRISRRCTAAPARRLVSAISLLGGQAAG